MQRHTAQISGLLCVPYMTSLLGHISSFYFFHVIPSIKYSVTNRLEITFLSHLFIYFSLAFLIMSFPLVTIFLLHFCFSFCYHFNWILNSDLLSIYICFHPIIYNFLSLSYRSNVTHCMRFVCYKGVGRNILPDMQSGPDIPLSGPESAILTSVRWLITESLSLLALLATSAGVTQANAIFSHLFVLFVRYNQRMLFLRPQLNHQSGENSLCFTYSC